jgi:CYTH domain-containing protein
MAHEIEREKTYLLSEVPDVSQWAEEYTKDIYFPPDTNNPQIRLRQRGNTKFLTKKYPEVEGDLSTMIEETIRLSDSEYDFFEKSLKGKAIEKRRYSKRIGSLVFELDEYLGDLAPLVVLDIEWEDEAPSESTLQEFPIVKEITNVDKLAAGKIAGKTYKEIEEHVL